MLWFWVLVGAALLVLALVIVLQRRRRLRLSASQSAAITLQWKRLSNINDPARRVLEAENILDHALGQLGYEGSFGEKLKKIGPRFPQQEALWQAHKLRNRIAHEAGIAVSPHVAERAVAVFGEVLEELMN